MDTSQPAIVAGDFNDYLSPEWDPLPSPINWMLAAGFIAGDALIRSEPLGFGDDRRNWRRPILVAEKPVTVAWPPADVIINPLQPGCLFHLKNWPGWGLPFICSWGCGGTWSKPVYGNRQKRPI